MRRLVAAILITAGSGCTAFDFAAPGNPAPDGGPDATRDATSDAADAGPGVDAGAGLLSLSQAAQLCSLIFECPRLAAAIDASLVIPLDYPSTPLNFSGCMDWLAGPIDPARVGLARQRAILETVAQATSCQAAYQACPVQPVDGGATCQATSCASASTLETCSSAEGSFVTACGPPLFADAEGCDTARTGAAICLALGNCTTGTSCSAAGALVDCYVGGKAFTAYDCTLSGRACGGGSPTDCVVPGSLAAPCANDMPFDGCNGSATSVRHCAGGRLPQTEFDCNAVGRICSTLHGAARCVGGSDDCSPFDQDVNACDGGISICVGGQRSTLDCSKVTGVDGGALQCVPGNGTQTGHCG
jgi:hypothetical protein